VQQVSRLFQVFSISSAALVGIGADSGGRFGKIGSMPAGRPRSPLEYLCQRVSTLTRIFTWGIPVDKWRHMHRPMKHPGDPDEDARRRKEYADILAKLGYSEFVGRCDADDSASYPARILLWQHQELFPENIVERRSEFARRLALFLVAEDATVSLEYLQKACRKYTAPVPKRSVIPPDFGLT